MRAFGSSRIQRKRGRVEAEDSFATRQQERVVARAAHQAAERPGARRARGARADRSPGRSGGRGGPSRSRNHTRPVSGTHSAFSSKAPRQSTTSSGVAIISVPPGRDSRARHLLTSNLFGRCHENHQCRSPLSPPAGDQGPHRQLAGRAADPHHHRCRDHRLGRGRRLPVGGQGDRRSADVPHHRHRPAPHPHRRGPDGDRAALAQDVPGHALLRPRRGGDPGHGRDRPRACGTSRARR